MAQAPNTPEMPERRHVAFSVRYNRQTRGMGICGWHVPSEGQTPFEPHWDSLAEVPWLQGASLLGAMLQGYYEMAPNVSRCWELERQGLTPDEAWAQLEREAKRENEIGER